MTKRRVLVVDDEWINLEILSEFFADDETLEIDTVDHGEKAWQRLLEASPAYSLILLDRMMPDLDGVDLLRRIKADPRFATIPVIMQTAATAPEKIREGLEAGAYYYLTKPYKRENLLAIAHAALADAEHRAALNRQLHQHINCLQFLTEGEFSIRTISEAGQLASFIANACPNPDLAVMGVSELLVNGVEHGNLGLCYQDKRTLKQEDRWQEEVARRAELPENLEKRVTLRFERHPSEIKLTVTDEGKGFDWENYLDIDPARAFDPNGRGIALARRLSFSSINYEQGGSVAIATISTTTGE